MRFECGNVKYSGDVKLQFEILSSEDQKLNFIDMIMQRLKSEFGLLNGGEDNKVRLCLDEAITNAIQHGNKGDSELKIRIKFVQNGNSFGFAISDEGTGLKEADLPDYDDANFLENSINGRGLLLIDNIADDLTYYSSTRELVFTLKIRDAKD